MTRRRWAWSGSLVGALVAAGALAARRGPDPDEVYERSLGAIEAARFDEAEADLGRLARLRDPTVLDWGLRARLEIARGRTDRAIAALAKVPEEHPLSGWARLRSGQLASRRRRFRAAEADLRRALVREPGLIEARRALIYILGLQLRRDELHREFVLLAESAPLTPREVWLWCMSRDLIAWTPAEHASILEEALRADPADRWSRLALAENRRRQGNYPEARAILGPLPVSDPDACAARAGLDLEMGDAEAAASELAEGPADHPRLAGLRGRLASGRGDAAGAVRHFEVARAAEPDLRRSLSDLGRAWMMAGSPHEARPYLDAATRIDALNGLLKGAEGHLGEPDPDLWRRLGAASEAAGRLPQARSWYRLAVAHDPLDTEAQSALARLGP